MTDAPGADEELLDSGRRWPGWMRVLPVLAVVAVIVLLVQQSSTPKAPRSAPSSAATTPDFTAAPDGPAPTGDPRHCPVAVMCSVLSTAPVPVVMAVLDHLPGAVVRTVHSIDYVSAAEHREVVWFRQIQVRSGSAQIVVEIRQPASGDRDDERSYVIGGHRGVHLRRVFFDRAVSITLDGPGMQPTLGQLRGLAADVRLVAA